MKNVQKKIYEIRGQRIMIDSDLADLYDTETKALNLAVKRNRKRFPKDFMFQLTRKEYESLQLQRAKNEQQSLRFQNETSKGRGGTRYLPYAFTEQGVAMLSGVLHSDKAIRMNIVIMRTFVEIRNIYLEQVELKTYIKDILSHLDDHDGQLIQIFAVLEHLINEKKKQKKWEEREQIGFKKQGLLPK